jgi:hypothetical protein
MTTLLSTVKSHCTNQGSSGVTTLKLTLICIEQMRDNQNEWSTLAWLMGKSQPAQARVIRKIVGQALHGWTVSKDTKQLSGIRFTKAKGVNQGYDETVLNVLTALVDDGAPIQGAAVKEAFPSPESAEKTHDEKVAMFVKAIKSRMEKDEVSWTEVVQGIMGEPEVSF